MSDYKPYQDNDDQWDEILPDSNDAWRKMEHLLDQDKRRRVLPPLFWNCAGLTLAALMLVIGGWFYFKNDKSKDETLKPVIAQDKPVKSSQVNTTTNTHKPQLTEKLNETTSGTSNATAGLTKSPIKNTIVDDKTPGSEAESAPFTNNRSQDNLHPGSHVNHKPTAPTTKSNNNADHKRGTQEKNELAISSKPGEPTETPGRNSVQPGEQKNSVFIPGNKNSDKTSIKTVNTNNKLPDSSLSAVAKPNAVMIDSTVSLAAITTPKNKKQQKFYLTAGLGLQQQLRTSSQVAYAENYHGKKSVFTEHIPSVYLKLHYGKWFLQGEFRYSAPQLVKDYYYADNFILKDSVIMSTSLKLRKLYYHQVPLSINYHVLPNLSVGFGGVYSLFHRAVSEETIGQKNINTQSQSFSKSTRQIPGFRDSFLFKTQVQVMLQADYHWKKWSLGARYKKDLEPYIRYMKPDGLITDEKNDALEFILRYRLWSNKR